MLKVITVTTDLGSTMPLIKSLERCGWDWQAIRVDWQGFGSKLISVYEYLKANPEVTSFIFCDAFDVVALGGVAEFVEKVNANFGFDSIICSAEKGLWPPNLEPNRNRYANHSHGFNFINSGCYYAPSELFINLFDANPPSYETDDQWWFNMCWLDSDFPIMIDTEQVLFNSHSFIAEGEYSYENGRIQINGNESCFIHKNGRTEDPKLDDLIAKL